MQTVAIQQNDGVLGPTWKCELCGREFAFLSVMIAHLFTDHSVRALSQSGPLITGIVNPEQ